MANILDIFRTHTGDRLLNRSAEITSLDKAQLKRTYLIILPAVLAICKNKESIKEVDTRDIFQFLEKEDLIASGKMVIEDLLNKKQLDILNNCNELIDMNKDSFSDIVKISASFLSVIVNGILQKNKHAQFTDVIKTLTGEETKFDRAFISVLVKNDDSPDLIASSEEIALNPKKDDDEQSILGGYSGGR